MKQEGMLTWDLLQGNLVRQVDAYQRLDVLLASENQVLIHHKVEKLIEITARKEQINFELQQFRADYFHLVSQIILGERPDQSQADPARVVDDIGQKREPAELVRVVVDRVLGGGRVG